MDVYIDIDGVLINTKNDKEASVIIGEFLSKLTEKYNVYWLTTRVKDGSAEGAIRVLSEYVSIEVLKSIKPTVWNTWKTEAINWGNDFVWIDDYVFPAELDELKKRNMENKLFLIADKNPSNLEKVIKLLDKKYVLEDTTI